MYCELFSSKLAIITTAREQNFVQGLLRSQFKPGIKTITYQLLQKVLLYTQYKKISNVYPYFGYSNLLRNPA